MFGFRIVKDTPAAPAQVQTHEGVVLPVQTATVETIAAANGPSTAKEAAVAVLHGLQWAVENAEAHPELIALAAKIVASSAGPNSQAGQIANVVATVAGAASAVR